MRGCRWSGHSRPPPNGNLPRQRKIQAAHPGNTLRVLDFFVSVISPFFERPAYFDFFAVSQP
jgi:hypothetical protein